MTIRLVLNCELNIKVLLHYVEHYKRLYFHRLTWSYSSSNLGSVCIPTVSAVCVPSLTRTSSLSSLGSGTFITVGLGGGGTGSLWRYLADGGRGEGLGSGDFGRGFSLSCCCLLKKYVHEQNDSSKKTYKGSLYFRKLKFKTVAVIKYQNWLNTSNDLILYSNCDKTIIMQK